MKITYHQWKCVGCPKVVRFTGKHAFSPRPHWITLSAECSSNEIPRLNTSVCSIGCLETAGIIIRDLAQKSRYSIPCKKHIEATICNQCGKMVKVDRLNMVIGPSPLEDWTWIKTPAGRKDFCTVECQKNHSIHPENSVFVNFRFDDQMMMDRLIDAIDAPDFVEQINKPRERPPWLPRRLEEDVARINAEAGE